MANNAGTMRGSGGKGLLGYLANNFPDLYNQIAKQPVEPSKQFDFKDGHYAKKYPARSGRYMVRKRKI